MDWPLVAGLFAGFLVGGTLVSWLAERRAAPLGGGRRVYVGGVEPTRFTPGPRFNDRAKRVLALAQDDAVRHGHNYIGTEHLLLGLVRDGGVARVFASLGVDIAKARMGVELIMGSPGYAGSSSSSRPPSEITLTPRTKKVIELAIDEAGTLGQSRVAPEHLLLGLVREGQGIAAGVLVSLGVALESARQEVLRVLREPLGPEGPTE